MPEPDTARGQAGPPLLAPQPGPCQVLAAVAQLSDGSRAVQLSLVTTSGTMTVFLPCDHAAAIGRDLVQKAALARTGLTLAQPVPVLGGFPDGGPRAR